MRLKANGNAIWEKGFCFSERTATTDFFTRRRCWVFHINISVNDLMLISERKRSALQAIKT